VKGAVPVVPRGHTRPQLVLRHAAAVPPGQAKRSPALPAVFRGKGYHTNNSTGATSCR
jgi:hypothetical protein